MVAEVALRRPSKDSACGLWEIQGDWHVGLWAHGPKVTFYPFPLGSCHVVRVPAPWYLQSRGCCRGRIKPTTHHTNCIQPPILTEQATCSPSLGQNLVFFRVIAYPMSCGTSISSTAAPFSEGNGVWQGNGVGNSSGYNTTLPWCLKTPMVLRTLPPLNPPPPPPILPIEWDTPQTLGSA